MLTALDEAVGKVLDSLRAARLEENTLIFFLSDNGGPTMLGTTINASRNTPFRGSKRTTLEGGIHVPFVVQWKGKLRAGTVYDRPVIQLDILPTALAAAGAGAASDSRLDGVNLLPYLAGETAAAPHEELYWRMGEQFAIRRGDWKLVQYDEAADHSDKRSVATQVKVTPPRLYNLAKDPGERHDLAAENPGALQELRSVWQAWNAQLARPLWVPVIAPAGSEGGESQPTEAGASRRSGGPRSSD
jgi:arylsulfatase A-like enzyme